MYNPETVEKLFGNIETNIGVIPMIDYLNIRLEQTKGMHDCETLEEFLQCGFSFPEFPELTKEDLDAYNCKLEDMMLQNAVHEEYEID